MNRLQLTRNEKFSFYLLPIILAALGCIPFYNLITGKANQHLPVWILAVSSGIFFLAAIALLLILPRSLEFMTIISETDIDTKRKIIRQLLRDYHWIYKKNQTNFIQATGFGFRDKIDLRTWSDQITIIVRRHDILVNCICDPDFAQPFSFGKRRQIMKDFEILFLSATGEIKSNQQSNTPV